MNFWAYILRCADGSYYTGHTDNLDGRIWQHQTGAMRGYTYTRRPVELVWSDVFSNRADAQETEHRVKGWSRAKKEALIAENWDRLKRMAMPPGERAERPQSKQTHRLPERSRGTNSSVAENIDPAASTSLGIVPRLRSGSRALTPPPLIILVRPQLGENIGKAARAMLNFGLTELRLVAPRDGWPNPSAGPAAAGADIVLERARVFDSVAEATADCAHVFATTVRKRGVVKPVMSPSEAAIAVRAGPERSAILFGAERSGLSSDDVAIARTLITVPVNAEFGSLNLAQAVILIAYEWSKGEALVSPPKTALDPPAPQDELDGMIGQLEAMLDTAGHFHPPARAHIDRRIIRSILTKPGWSAQEVRTLRGVLRSLSGRSPRQG